MNKMYKSQLELIGNTPLLDCQKFCEELKVNAKIFAKIESYNPAGSVKDRAALYMIKTAEKEGKLKAGGTVIEPTSGNTGIGLGLVCKALGYKLIIVLPDSMSKERRKLISSYGAELVLTDGKLGMSGAIKKAKELNEQIEGSIIAGQFENPANAKAHFETTGPEIWEQTEGKVDIFVAGVGTGGTITGVGEYLKLKNPDIKIVAVEPDCSAVLSGKEAGPHKLQGIGAGFIPKVLNKEIIDEVIPVSVENAYEMARLLGKTEGVLSGISSGAALFGATEIAKREENKGKNIVVLLPDGIDRYLSTDLYNI